MQNVKSNKLNKLSTTGDNYIGYEILISSRMKD